MDGDICILWDHNVSNGFVGLFNDYSIKGLSILNLSAESNVKTYDKKSTEIK